MGTVAMTEPLKHLKILDLTIRLPGPFSTHLLANLGAQVEKIEFLPKRDPFLDSPEKAFETWHDHFQSHKKITLLSPDNQSHLKTLRDKIQESHIILFSLGKSLQKKIKWEQLLQEKKQQQSHGLLMELVASSKSNRPMHDLNVMAKTNLLPLYIHEFPENMTILPPPFLPWLGLSFGHHLAINMLAYFQQATEENKVLEQQCAFLEYATQIFSPLWAPQFQKEGQKKFLWNGAYPCYLIYKIKDGNYLAVASVEKKFWIKFLKTFNIPLTEDDRFSQNSKTFELISQSLLQYDSQDIENLANGEEFCINLIKT